MRKWPGLAIPVLPREKRIVTYTQDTFADKRLQKLRRHLELFLRLAVGVQELCISEEFLMFISPAIPDYKAALKSVVVPQVSDILVNFKLMSQVSAVDNVSPAMLVEIAEAQLLFIAARGQIKQMRKCCKAAIAAVEDFGTNFPTFSEVLAGIEADVIASCTFEWMPLYAQSQYPEVTNPYITIETWSLEQAIEIESMLEAIATRENLERLKQQHAHTIEDLREDLQRLKYSESSPSWFHSKPKFEKVAEAGDRLEQAEADLWSLGQLIDFVCFRLVQVEIPQAKKRLAKAYRAMMSQFEQDTMVHASPFCQFAANIKNALALSASNLALTTYI